VNAKVKEFLVNLPPSEQVEAAAYLKVLQRLQDPSFHQEMKQRSEQLQAGSHRIQGKTILDIDKTLTDSGL